MGKDLASDVGALVTNTVEPLNVDSLITEMRKPDDYPVC